VPPVILCVNRFTSNVRCFLASLIAVGHDGFDLRAGVLFVLVDQGRQLVGIFNLTCGGFRGGYGFY